ncbi:hypothetical protein HPP92_007844 [Vanilla planifolia]|uniref:Pentatricopeptide repeat-containing protein n=1 Tax=Vanilla planifolia TaxID=51239 RepID=A0A835RMR8_VANPL|nr:hypothetical protein HPP92_007844 [Vanilla planifolia]
MLGVKLLNCYAHCGRLWESKWLFSKIIDRNIFLWKSVIVEFYRAGQFEEILRLYDILKLYRIGIDSSNITFSLKGCAELKNAVTGRAIHADSLKVGLNIDKFVASSIIRLYCLCGKIDEGYRAFTEILDKDVVAYTSMITGCAMFPGLNANMAFEITSDMHRRGLCANRVTLVSLLRVAGHLEALREGQAAHCFAMRRGISFLDEALGTAIVDMYARCGALDLAASVFRQMEKTCTALWNALISGLILWGKSAEALKVYGNMEKDQKIFPDSITLSNLIAVCADLDFLYRAKDIHGYLIRQEILLDLPLVTSLIDLYFKGGKVHHANKLFAEIMVRDTILYDVMISGYIQNNKTDHAIQTFQRMLQEGINPNSTTILILLSAFSDATDTRLGKWIHAFTIRHSLNLSFDVCNQILQMYAKWGCLETARMLFESIARKDLVSWTVMMMAYVNHGYADKAFLLFHKMQQSGEKPDSITLITLLKAHNEIGCPRTVKEIHGHVYRTLLVRDNTTMNSIITAYAKCGKLDMAKSVFNSIPKECVTSWNTMIAAYGIHGCVEEVISLFNEMQRQSISPDGMTGTSVLSACSHGGLIEVGLHVFNIMTNELSFSPSEEHYNCMVDLLGRAGRLEEAHDLVKHFPLKDRRSALCALLAGCRIHNNVKLGEVVGKELLELEPHNPGNYSLISNIYCQQNMWNKAEVVRTKARMNGLQKAPGFSLVNLNE